MNHRIAWALRNIAPVIAVWALTFTWEVYRQAGEVDALGYASLAEMLPRASAATCQRVLTPLRRHGQIREWDYEPLLVDTFNEVKMSAAPKNIGSIASERQNLIRVAEACALVVTPG